MTRLVLAPVVGLVVAASMLVSGCAPVVVGAAAVGGVTVAVDRRTADTQLADERIEVTASKWIGEKILEQGHVNIVSYNKTVLLTGETTTAALKEEVGKLAAGATGVKDVVNEITIGPLAPLSSRSNDAYLTTLVKTRFVNDQKFNPLHVKVVTEDKTVYLLGLVTRKEGDDAANIARYVSGVKRVVKVFEYIPDPPTPASKPPAGTPPPKN
jgi:osmotically-inducible protein OsmY